jgi:hypothetical protein
MRRERAATLAVADDGALVSGFGIRVEVGEVAPRAHSVAVHTRCLHPHPHPPGSAIFHSAASVGVYIPSTKYM